MVTLSDCTSFSGNQGGEASRWLQSFVVATHSYSEGALLRIFPTYLELDSPAQKWYDGLSDNVKGTWNSVQREFRQRWVAGVGGQASMGEGSNADKFRNHRLTDDEIFTPTSVGVADWNKIIFDWVEEHARLGAAAGLDQMALMQTTLPNIPAFLRAFLRYDLAPPTTFQGLCKALQEIEDWTLKFENLRRQEKNVEWMHELLQIVKKTQKSSPSSNGREEIPTSTTGAEEDGTKLFFLPEEWKKSKVSASKAEMVEAVKQVIRTIHEYRPSDITIDAGRMIDIGILRYCNAIKAPGQFHSNCVARRTGTQSTAWLGLFQIHYQQTFNKSGGAIEVTKAWESISGSKDIIQREDIYKPKHTRYSVSATNSTSTYDISPKSVPYCGGLAQPRNGTEFPFLWASTFSTAQYLALSGYLAESTTADRSRYIQAAIDSANWIIKWGYDDGIHLVNLFVWDLDKGQTWGTTSLSPYVTGLFIEGLCVLASVTDEEKWMNLAVNVCNAAMVYREWYNDEGIFRYVPSPGASDADDANIYKGLLIRGLLVAYQRNPNNEELRHKIRSYINVQFNGLRDYAHYRGSYGTNWSGPYSGPSVYAEMAALDVLMAVVAVNHPN